MLLIINSWICKLTSLKKLDISWNKLLRLPSEIGELSSLEKLNISGNKLQELPVEMSQLTATISSFDRSINLA